MIQGQPPSFTLTPANTHPSVPDGDTVLLEVIDRNSLGLFFTRTGVVLPDLGYIPYKRITRLDYRWPDKLLTDAYVDLIFRDAPKARINLRTHEEVVSLVLWFSKAKGEFAG